VVSGRSFFEWEGHAAAVLRLKFGGGDAAGVVRSLVGLGLCVFFLLDLCVSFLDHEGLSDQMYISLVVKAL
jgi:hypothetical protein